MVIRGCNGRGDRPDLEGPEGIHACLARLEGLRNEVLEGFALPARDNLHVATSKNGIPRSKSGDPIPGQFAYGDEYGGCLDAPVTFEIPLDEIDGGVGPGDTVAIAAHAEVEDDARQEGAWGEGTRFVARGNWAMSFTYAVQEGACGGADSCTVFVTSTTHAGNFGGLDGADAICQARAESLVSMAPPGAYKAWLSTSAASSAARLTHATVPDRLVDGTIVANNWTDLTDCDLQAPINRRENGILGTVRCAPWHKLQRASTIG